MFIGPVDIKMPAEPRKSAQTIAFPAPQLATAKTTTAMIDFGPTRLMVQLPPSLPLHLKQNPQIQMGR